MTLFSSNYFDNNMRRLLGLRAFSIEHKNMDKVSDKEIAYTIRTGLKIKGNYEKSSRDRLINTINNNFGGLAKIRALPLWKVHIDIAMAIFNNRFQIIKDGVKTNMRNNPKAITSELFARFLGSQLYSSSGIKKICEAEQSRRAHKSSLVDYKIACTLLPRISTLDNKEVKQLCAFLIEWIVGKYKINFDRGNSVDLTNVVSMFNKNYNHEFVDLGPASTILNNFQMSEDALGEVYKVWESIDDDFPILHPNFVKHKLAEDISDVEEPPAKKRLLRCPRPHPRYFSSESNDDEQPSAKNHLQRSGRSHQRSCNTVSKSQDIEKVLMHQQHSELPKRISYPRSKNNFKNRNSSSLLAAAPNHSSPFAKSGALQNSRSVDLKNDSTTVIIPSLSNGHHSYPSNKQVHQENVQNFENNENVSFTKQLAAELQRKLEHVTKLTKKIDVREAELKKREKNLLEKEKEVSEKEKTLLQKKKHIFTENLKQKSELEDIKKKIKDREEFQMDREKTHNYREISQTKREMSQTGREMSQNNREETQNRREEILNEKQNLLINQLSQYIIFEKSETSVYAGDADDESSSIDKAKVKRGRTRLTKINSMKQLRVKKTVKK